MSAIRQDAWTDDEDLLLAETVLRHIREGSTQLAAFEEVGKKLSRTSAACGFRWNSLIRKRYENAISLAKKQRKDLNKRSKEETKKKERPVVRMVDRDIRVEETEPLDLKRVIAYLEQMNESSQDEHILKNQIVALEERIEVLQSERVQLLRENQKLKEDFNTIKEDYQSLIQIMDRARRFTEPAGQENEWDEVTEALSLTDKKE